MLDNGTGDGVGLGKIMTMKKLLIMDHGTRRSGLTLVSYSIALSFDYSCGWIPQLSRSIHGAACSSFILDQLCRWATKTYPIPPRGVARESGALPAAITMALIIINSTLLLCAKHPS